MLGNYTNLMKKQKIVTVLWYRRPIISGWQLRTLLKKFAPVRCHRCLMPCSFIFIFNTKHFGTFISTRCLPNVWGLQLPETLTKGSFTSAGHILAKTSTTHMDISLGYILLEKYL